MGAEKTWCGGVDCATGAGDVVRSGVRSAMCAASQLSGRGPTGVDVALPLYLHVNQKSDYDMMI